jgi:uncharacterized protein (DUF983 family)
MTNFAPCPNCESIFADKVGFTWWGGLIGPRILTHVKCTKCGHTYNGKTGRDNTTGIVVYCLIVGLLAIGLVVVGIAGAIALAVATN